MNGKYFLIIFFLAISCKRVKQSDDTLYSKHLQT